MTTGVNEKSAAIKAMATEWSMIDALMAGTPEMRAGKKTYLPQWPNEIDQAYENRVKVATLFPAYRRTISVMSGKPFAKELQLSEDTPEQIRKWAEDIDMEGTNLHSFASEMFIQAMGWGYGGILVDAPKVTTTNGRPPTRAEQAKENVRPYFVRIKADQILGWREERIGAAARLTQFRFMQNELRADGEFGEKLVQRVWVLTPGAYAIFEENTTGNQKAWTPVESGTTGVDFIPFVPIYGFRQRFMVGAVPMLDLAYQNVKHYQSQSDQDTILHVARVPILFAKCFGDSEAIIVGSSVATKADHENSDLRYVEHSGAAIAAGAQSLKDLEEQMIQTGAELLVKKPGDRSATESANDAEGNKSDLQRIAETFEDSIDLALSYMARFASLDKGGKATLYRDYGATNLTEASGQLVNDLQSRGIISKETTIKEQQRRGVLSADIDPAKEIRKAEEEGPAPGTVDDNAVE